MVYRPESPYNSIDLVPVNYSFTMAESVYRQDYLDERLQLWVDNLNLLYVAFTRAGKNLILWSKKDQKAQWQNFFPLPCRELPKREKAVGTKMRRSMKAERHARRRKSLLTLQEIRKAKS